MNQNEHTKKATKSLVESCDSFDNTCFFCYFIFIGAIRIKVKAVYNTSVFVLQYRM